MSVHFRHFYDKRKRAVSSCGSLYDNAKFLGCAYCYSYGKGRLYFIAAMRWCKKRSETWEPKRNVPPLLDDRFSKGEKIKDLDSTAMYGVTNLLLYQVTKIHQDHYTQKVAK